MKPLVPFALIALVAGCDPDPPSPAERAVAEADDSADALDRRANALEDEAEALESRADALRAEGKARAGELIDQAVVDSEAPARITDPAPESAERSEQQR